MVWVNRNKTRVMIGVRIKPEAVAVLKRRAARQGRTFNEYMCFFLEDEAFRDHNTARTERQRRKQEKAKEGPGYSGAQS